MSKEKSFKFESAMEQLEKIVSKLEGDNASLENTKVLSSSLLLLLRLQCFVARYSMH